MSDLTDSTNIDTTNTDNNTDTDNTNTDNTDTDNTNTDNTNTDNTDADNTNTDNTNTENTDTDNTNDANSGSIDQENMIGYKEFDIECPLCKQINYINHGEGSIFNIREICMVCNKNNINVILPNCNHFCICLDCTILIRTPSEKYK